MIVRRSRPEEARRINELFAICFETPYSNCPIDPEHDTAMHWVALDDDGEMMSNFTVGDFPINFDGRTCRMGGVGGVATLPQYRRRGGIRACFQAALPELYQEGFDFSYLYPFSTAYYRKFGYECCVQAFQWEVDLRQLNPPRDSGSFRLSEQNRPQTEAIRSLDQLWERKYNMMVQHQAQDYDWTCKADPAVKQEFTYVCYDDAGTPKAYTTFKVSEDSKGRALQCSRLCFADKLGFTLLMQLFKSMSADHAYARFKTPVLTGLQYLLPEWSQGAVRWELLASYGMVRVVNVQSVLEKAAYHGSGTVTLEIRDSQIPENNGCYTVHFQDGKAVAVEKGRAVPDASLTISAFSALIAGVCDFTDAAGNLTDLNVHSDSAALSQIFYRKPMYIADFF